MIQKEVNNFEKKKLILAYNKLKKQLDEIRHDQTLRKWRILSKAYKLGKKIYGQGYTREKLSLDFELPYTTTKRLLALDRANKRTLVLMKQGKISAFKVAQICDTKSITYQDEIVDLVIKQKLTTYDIKALRIKQFQDIKKEKLRLAIEKGFTKKYFAGKSFLNYINKMEIVLFIEPEELPPRRLGLIKNRLQELKEKIEAYLIKLEEYGIK